jgi:hypothetical protein
MFVLLKDAAEMDNVLLILCCVIHRSIFTVYCHVIIIKPVPCFFYTLSVTVKLNLYQIRLTTVKFE